MPPITPYRLWQALYAGLMFGFGLITLNMANLAGWWFDFAHDSNAAQFGADPARHLRAPLQIVMTTQLIHITSWLAIAALFMAIVAAVMLGSYRHLAGIAGATIGLYLLFRMDLNGILRENLLLITLSAVVGMVFVAITPAVNRFTHFVGYTAYGICLRLASRSPRDASSILGSKVAGRNPGFGPIDRTTAAGASWPGREAILDHNAPDVPQDQIQTDGPATSRPGWPQQF